jgi:hypothetical protein
MAKHVVPLMKAKKSGSIVNVGSISSFIAQPGFVPYNTTKVKSLHPISSTSSLIYYSLSLSLSGRGLAADALSGDGLR